MKGEIGEWVNEQAQRHKVKNEEVKRHRELYDWRLQNRKRQTSEHRQRTTDNSQLSTRYSALGTNYNADRC